MNIWRNTNTLNGFDKGLKFVEDKNVADILLLGSKSINLTNFKNVKAIFRAGIGKDNVPEIQAKKRNIIIEYPSKDTQEIIFSETANFTCSLIFKMFYQNIGSVDSWIKYPRDELLSKKLLIIGMSKIGSRVAVLMKPFLKVITFDILKNNIEDLKSLIKQADCISLHIPKNKKNESFFDIKKLSWMKNCSILINTARGDIVDENALYEELKKNRIKVAFDVFWKEPYTGKLKEFYPDPFFMSPHVASTCRGFLKGCREDLNKLIYKLS